MSEFQNDRSSPDDKSLVLCDRIAKVAHDLQLAAARGESTDGPQLLKIAASLSRIAAESRRDIRERSEPMPHKTSPSKSRAIS